MRKLFIWKSVLTIVRNNLILLLYSAVWGTIMLFLTGVFLRNFTGGGSILEIIVICFFLFPFIIATGFVIYLVAELLKPDESLLISFISISLVPALATYGWIIGEGKVVALLLLPFSPMLVVDHYLYDYSAAVACLFCYGYAFLRLNDTEKKYTTKYIKIASVIVLGIFTARISGFC